MPPRCRELRPTLDAITQRVNGDNLARMRHVKGRLLRAVNKVAAVRNEARAREACVPLHWPSFPGSGGAAHHVGVRSALSVCVRAQVSRILEDDAAIKQMCLTFRAKQAAAIAAAASAAEGTEQRGPPDEACCFPLRSVPSRPPNTVRALACF